MVTQDGIQRIPPRWVETFKDKEDLLPVVHVNGRGICALIEWERVEDEHGEWHVRREGPQDLYVFVGKVSLDLSGLGITDISQVKGLDTIERIDELDLSNNRITSLDWLARMPWALADNGITEPLHYDGDDYAPRDPKDTIKVLNLSNNEITEFPEVPILGLHTLVLGHNKISTIEAKQLDNLQHLQILDISSNDIQDISFLTHLPNLKKVGLRNNRIKSIPDLHRLEEITYLNLNGNQIHAESDLDNLPVQCWTQLGNNQLDRETLGKYKKKFDDLNSINTI